MGSLSPWHWAILAVVIIVLFGAKRLPDAARSLGKSMRIFKSEMHELHADGPDPAAGVQGDDAGPPRTTPTCQS
jgi:sec-independent protein translocase protein TatA